MRNVNFTLTSVECAILLSEKYDEKFGLSGKDEVMSSVIYREQESPLEYSRYRDYLNAYILLDINKFFGISIDEFLNRTSWEIELLIKAADERITALAENLEEVEQEIDVKEGYVGLS